MNWPADLADTAVRDVADQAVPVATAAGIEAWQVESAVVPLVALAFTFEGGAAQDPPGKAGVAQLLARLLDEGAGALRSDAFQERLAARAIELSLHMPAPTRSAARSRRWSSTPTRPSTCCGSPSPSRASTPTRSSGCAAQTLAGLRYQQNDPGIDGLAPLLRRGLCRPSLRPPVVGHDRERRGDHPRRPRGHAPARSSRRGGVKVAAVGAIDADAPRRRARPGLRRPAGGRPAHGRAADAGPGSRPRVTWSISTCRNR